MDETRFQGLVAFTRQAFMSRHQRNWGEPPVETRLRMFQKVLPKRGRYEFLHSLIVESADSRLAWESVKLIAENMLRGEEPLPAELRKWIADVLSDLHRQKKDKRRPRPSKGGSREANRDWVICGAIHHIGLRFRLPPTRNGAGPEECCAEGGSASDVVGRAAFDATLNAYKNTERIWGRRDPLLSYAIQKEE